MGQTSFWTNSTVPRTREVTSDTASVSLGLKFYSNVPGSVTAIRFYKGSHNVGTHVGTIWSATGTNLGSVIFSNETASGWQQATFASPVPIAANTIYTASYLAPRGYYAVDQKYTWANLSNSLLRVAGANPGVFKYGIDSTYPTETWKSSNYWVDVLFVPATPPIVPTTFNISGKVSGSQATVALSGDASQSTTTDASGNYTFSGLASGSYAVTATQPGYSLTPVSIPVSIAGASVTGVNFIGVPITSASFWPYATIPSTPQADDTASVTLGLKFTSDVPGTVTAVRFYKGSRNAGTHVGELWSSTGSKLASVIFSEETDSGWQQANFSAPVRIAANTPYVVSYFAPSGAYACEENYDWFALSAGPLRVSGSTPGVFAYGPGSQFPTGTWNASNYSVDVVFLPDTATSTVSPPAPPPTTYSISGRVSGSTANLTISGPVSGATTTDGLGNYSFSGLSNGLYVISASRSGYTFTPSTASATVNGAPVSGVNFTGTEVPAPLPHSVTLSWAPSSSQDIQGYNVYRADVAGGTYVKVNVIPVRTTAYVDTTITSGRIYYYVATAVDSNNAESTYSNETTAVLPAP
jgi:hypothetical protein